ncbi:MAG: helix-turn-helix domain-containing protein [Clostridia bacterium]|nr:helix-turn-helix domain-containing protein [Clostridia bacterium]
MNEIIYAGQHALVSQVSRHTHEHWEFVYCTHGGGSFSLEAASMPYQRGDVAVIPPRVPHANFSEGGMRNIYVEMASPAFTVPEPAVVRCADPFLLRAFEGAYHHFQSDEPRRDTLLRLYGALICTYLAASGGTPPHPPVVDGIAKTIEANVANSDFDLGTYLRSLPFSEDYLRRLFQRSCGVTPLGYLTELRLNRAAQLLGCSDRSGLSVIDIARACGYRDALYFSRMFKRKFGVSPIHYPPDASR